MPLLRYFFLAVVIAVITVVGLAGLRGTAFHKFSRPPIELVPDMDRQAKFKAQSPSVFFGDGRASRMPVPGTVPLENPVENEYLSTGRMGDRWGAGFPVPVTPALIARGQERFQINCAICHGATGAGNGMAKQFGVTTVASLHQDRLRDMPEGEIFHTISKGRGTMGAYPHIKLEDRWAIIAYVRALQLSQNAPADELPENLRAKLK